MIYIDNITYVIYLEYDFTFPRLPGEECGKVGRASLPRVYIFAKNKGINIYTPTTVTSTLGDVDDKKNNYFLYFIFININIYISR